MSSFSPFEGSTLPRNMYPHLRDDVVLHASASFWALLYGDPASMFRTSKDTLEILAQCDGTRRFDEILNSRLISLDQSGYSEMVESFAAIAALVNNGLLLLSVEPRPKPPQVAGDFNCYYPAGIQVELTNACNLHCSYCYRDAGSQTHPDILPTDKLLRILREFADKGLRSIELTGGEPLLHPDFLKIAHFCGDSFALIGLLTNGTLVDDFLVQQLVPMRDKMVLSVSLDSYLPAVHDFRRGCQGAFEKTIRGIRLLSQHGFFTRVSMSLDQSTWTHIEETLLLARRLGATTFSYSPVLPFGRAQGKFELWSFDPSELFRVEENLINKYKGFIYFAPEDSVLDLQQPGGCGAGHKNYVMDPRGLIRPCATFPEHQAVFGSLVEQSLPEIFSSELVAAFAAVESPNFDICASCQWKGFCLNCVYRGLTGASWVGEDSCIWLQQPHVRHWRDLISKHTIDRPA